ncbi:MAG: hypothetical protein EBY39_03295 [Flavobacteriia bacterium]|nr:hypothetical protein [Flavobacteriia bacterium]
MANIDVRIKRKNSSSWDSLFPETTVDQIKTNSGSALSGFASNILEASSPGSTSFVKVAATTGAITFRTPSQTLSDLGAAAASHDHPQSEITDLDDALADKADLVGTTIDPDQIPDYLFSGLTFAGTTAGTTAADALDELLDDIDDAFGLGESPSSAERQGGYFVVTSEFTLTVPTGHRVLVYDDGTTSDLTLEAGDWIVYVGYGDANSAGSNAHEWAIINNTYKNATTSAVGVVKLSSGSITTRAGLSNATSNRHEKVMDEKAVRAVMKHIFYEANESSASTAQQGDLLFEGQY